MTWVIVTFRIGELNLLSLTKNRSTKFRNVIKTKSCVASINPMIGLLVRKFGSESVIKEFEYTWLLRPKQKVLQLKGNTWQLDSAHCELHLLEQPRQGPKNHSWCALFFPILESSVSFKCNLPRGLLKPFVQARSKSSTLWLGREECYKYSRIFCSPHILKVIVGLQKQRGHRATIEIHSDELDVR